MPALRHWTVLLVALHLPYAFSEVQVKGFAQTGSAPGKLTILGKLIMSLHMPHHPQYAYAGLQRFSASLDRSRAREELAADLLSACAGSDPARYAVAFSSYLATPDTKSAEAWAPLRWRYRSSGSNNATDAATQVRPALCLPWLPRAFLALLHAVLLPTTQEGGWRSPCGDYDIEADATFT